MSMGITPDINNTLSAFDDLIKILDSDNMSAADTVQQMRDKYVFKQKEKFVIEKHGSVFQPRTITKRGSKETVYRTKHNGKVIQAKEYKTFIDKVAEAYGLYDQTQNCDSITLDEVFRLAIDEKSKTENNNENTILKLNKEYIRYISQDFSQRPIKSISDIELKTYTQQLTRKETLKTKSFYAYKGILNLIFGYAIHHKIIKDNPVLAIKNSIYLKNCDTSRPKNIEKILSPKEINKVIEETNKRILDKKYNGYCVYAFVTQLAIETGMRAAELCALKKSDISDDKIHIHAQQLYIRREGGKDYYYAGYTKDEKGISNDGREFPLTPKIKSILDENEKCKQALHLESKFVFCNHDGEWIKSDAYETFLRRMMKSLNMPVTNNHAFRMSLNSNVLIPSGINVADRAALLGHSIETNLKHYSYARKDNLGELNNILTNYNNEVTTGHHEVIPFPRKKESLETLNHQCF